jgi:hypothetical protein
VGSGKGKRERVNKQVKYVINLVWVLICKT